MRLIRLFIYAGSVSALLWAAIGHARSVDDLTGGYEAPALSGDAERFAEDGYRNRSVLNGPRSDDRSLGFSEAGPDDKTINFRMDPISGTLSDGNAGH